MLRKHELSYFYRDQYCTSRLKYVGNLSTDVLFLFSSAIQSNKHSLFLWGGNGGGGCFYNKKLVLSLTASKGRLSASFKFPVTCYPTAAVD